MMGNEVSTPERALHQSPSPLASSKNVSKAAESIDYSGNFSTSSREHRLAHHDSPKLPEGEDTEYDDSSRRSSRKATSRPQSSANNEGCNFPGYLRSKQLLQQQQDSLSPSDVNKTKPEGNSIDRISQDFWPTGRTPPKGPRGMTKHSFPPSEDHTNKLAISELLKLEANERRQSSSSSGQRSFINAENALDHIGAHQRPTLLSNNSTRLKTQPDARYNKLQTSPGPASPRTQADSPSQTAHKSSNPRHLAEVVRTNSVNGAKTPSDTNDGAALDGCLKTIIDGNQVTTSQDYSEAKDCGTLLGASSSPVTPSFGAHKAECNAPPLDRSKECSSPHLPFLPKSLGSHLRFNGDDTKSLSSELSLSTGRTPSETSSTPSDMRVKKCHVCSKPQASDYMPLIACNGCRRRYHSGCHKPPIHFTSTTSETFKCTRCIKRSGLISVPPGKRAGSSLRPNGDKAPLPISTENDDFSLPDRDGRPTKRQKLNHCGRDGLPYALSAPSNQAGRSGVSPPMPQSEHRSSAGWELFATEREQPLAPANPASTSNGIPANSVHAKKVDPLRPKDSSPQAIKTSLETSDFYDIDSFEIGIEPGERKSTASSTREVAYPGSQAQKQDLPLDPDDDVLSDKSMSIESDQPEPTSTHQPLWRSACAPLNAGQADPIGEHDSPNPTLDLDPSGRFGSISPLDKRPSAVVDVTNMVLSITATCTPKSNGVKLFEDCTTSDNNHKHLSPDKAGLEAVNPSLKRYPLSTSPCSTCGKPVIKSFSKNSTKTLCVRCAKVNGSGLPAPCTPASVKDPLASTTLPGIVPLIKAYPSPSKEKVVSPDKSRSGLPGKTKPHQNRPFKVFPEQTSPFRNVAFKTVSSRIKRKFAAVKVNGVHEPAKAPIVSQSQPKPVASGDPEITEFARLPQPPLAEKQREESITSPTLSPPRRIAGDGSEPGHPEITSNRTKPTPRVKSAHHDKAESTIAQVEAAKGISQANLKQHDGESTFIPVETANATTQADLGPKQDDRESIRRILDLEKELATKELQLSEANLEIAALKERQSKSDEPDHERTIISLREELQRIQHQLKSQTSPASVNTNPTPSFRKKDLFEGWQQWRPQNVFFDRKAKAAEIERRPSRKATFGKRLANIRKERDNVHHEVHRPAPGSHNQISEPTARADEGLKPSVGGLESYGAGCPEAVLVPDDDDGEGDRQLSFEEIIGVPMNAIPTIYDKTLVYRDGTKGPMGKLPRAKVVYKVGRNVAGQLK